MAEEPSIDATSDRSGEPAVRVAHLSHDYARGGRAARRSGQPATLRALDDVSLSVPSGEIFAILGPNGGGKTTLFRILATLLRPRLADGADPGIAAIFGHDVVREPARVRAMLGLVFQHPSLDGKLSAQENLLHQGHLYGLSGRGLRERIGQWLEAFDLSDRRDDRVERFSGGMRRRVELAKALLHEPRLLLMDEPATGLDPAARRGVWEHLERQRQRGLSVVLTTHLMEEAERADRLAIVSRGRVIALASPAELKRRVGGDVIQLELEAEEAEQAAGLARMIAERFGPWADEPSQPRVVDGRIRLEQADGSQLVAQLAGAFPGRFRRMTVGQPTLEDVFVHLTGTSLAEEDDGDGRGAGHSMDDA